MGGERTSVLTDLSFAALGYCGIAQESRLFLKALWHHEKIDPTGLIFGRGAEVVGHRFPSTRRFDKRIECQAVFIQSLADGPPPGRFRYWKYLASALYHRHLPRRVKTDQLNNDFFWDAVWRNLLARTLDVEDIDIARQCRMLLTNLGGYIFGGRRLLGRRRLKLKTPGMDFAVFHTPTPVRVSAETTKIVRYYDLIPGIRPDLVSYRFLRNHFRDIRLCRHDSEFVCISEPARNDLLAVFPELKERTHCIPVVLSDSYYPDPQPNRFGRILMARHSNVAARHPEKPIRQLEESGKVPPYLIMTSTLEPRKNHILLIRAFEKLISMHQTDLRLVFVANPGWKSQEIICAMRPLIGNGRLFHLESVTTEELRILYSQAQALAFPSLYEGFGYTPLEAMRCQTPVIASDIAAHRWVYGDAALYCDPYCVDSLVHSIENLLFPLNRGLRDDLVGKGLRRAQLYSSKTVSNQWVELFDRLRSKKSGARSTHAASRKSLFPAYGLGIQDRERPSLARPAAGDIDPQRSSECYDDLASV